MTHARTFATLSLAFFSTPTATVASVSQQAPVTFRAGVDLVVVDVVVIDKAGVPVTDLVAADFTVTAGQRPRRIVSSEFVGVTRAGTNVAAAVPSGLPAPTTNQRVATPGRSILFVIDVDEIRSGEGRLAMRSIAEYVDGLDANDRVGLVTLPYGSPRVDFTTNRQLIRDAAGMVVGASRRMADAEMSPGEAAAIAAGDPGALAAWDARRRGLGVTPSIAGMTGNCLGPANIPPTGPPIEQPTVIPGDCKQKAERTLDVYRRSSRATLDTLRALAETMEPIAGQKALILVSEGFYTDAQLQRDMRAFASAAERARVALYALHLDASLMEAASRGGPTGDSRILDDRIGFDGMADLALAARGTALRVIAHPAGPLTRIDTELSGYYLLAFERSVEDADGEHIRIDVKVDRPGLDVRARREFTPVPLKAPAPEIKEARVDPRAAMGALLNWPAPIGDIVIDVDTFTMPVDATSPKVSVMIAAEIATGGRAVDVGFEVRDASGKTVADSFDPKADLQPLTDGRALYPVSVSVAPGAYTLTLGAIDPDGKRGSVRHAFEAKAWPPGPLRMSSVILGEVVAGAFRPAARLGAGSNVVAVRVEIHASSPTAFDMYTVRLDVTPVGGTTAVVTAPGRIAGAPDALRRAATTLVDLGDLPAGDYVVRVSLYAASGEVTAQSSRLLTLRH